MNERYDKQIRKARRRYLEREKRRGHRQASLDKLDWRQVDEPDRILARLERLGEKELIKTALDELASKTHEKPSKRILERIIKGSELMGICFLLEGACSSRSVARILIRNENGQRIGFGTGFMVSPQLFLTNNHVIASKAIAQNSSVQFDYYRTREGELTEPVEFEFDPQTFFIKSERLDFTLLAVKEKSLFLGKLVQAFGWNALIRESGKAIVGEHVNIIQHPVGDRKQVALRRNRITDVHGDFLQYTTDTEPGSSGSPVFNDQWDVAALHHAGVPSEDGQGWVSNEGVRISRIIQHLDKQSFSVRKKELYDRMFVPYRAGGTKSEIAQPDESQSEHPQLGQTTQEPDGSYSWNLKINLSPAGGVNRAAAGKDWV